MRWLWLSLIVLVLVACGQKGDLFFPEADNASKTPQKEEKSSKPDQSG